MHALDMDRGAVVWDNGNAAGIRNDASYAPTTAIPGVAFTGSIFAPQLRGWDTVTDPGPLRYAGFVSDVLLTNAIASAATVVDGTVLVGTGIGARSGDPHYVGDSVSREPRTLVALCVPGTKGCGACQNGIDDDRDNVADWPDDPGCASADDDSEKSADFACDDGIDNNGDGDVDFDDPNCSRGWPYWEVTPECGIGAELALVFPLLGLWRRRLPRWNERASGRSDSARLLRAVSAPRIASGS